MPRPTYAFRSTMGQSRGARLKSHIDQGGTPDEYPGKITTATRRWARDKGMKFEAEGKWPDDETMLAHRDKGFSSREIAEKMGAPSRNAVIGRLDRLRKSGAEVESKPADTARGKPSLPKLAFMEKPMEDE